MTTNTVGLSTSSKVGVYRRSSVSLILNIKDLLGIHEQSLGPGPVGGLTAIGPTKARNCKLPTLLGGL